jgi:hypothetical protein
MKGIFARSRILDEQAGGSGLKSGDKSPYLVPTATLPSALTSQVTPQEDPRTHASETEFASPLSPIGSEQGVSIQPRERPGRGG